MSSAVLRSSTVHRLLTTVAERNARIIRERYADGERLSDLAREYGISPQRVFQIVNEHKDQQKDE